MALRYSCKNAAVAVAGTAFTHGLTNHAGTATAPDEWAFNHRGAPSGGYGSLYLTAAPTTTTITLASGSGATTADVFCAINHTSIG